jgi:glucose-1-phosphate cytidylyltransferase
MTGGRVKRIQRYVGDETFMLTYGDGVCDININDLVEFHKSHGKIATMTAVTVGQRFGVLDIDSEGTINSFREKQTSDGSRINAGYMVMEPKIFDFIAGDSTVFEKEPLEKCAQLGELKAYIHNGYWQCMDTKREMEKLEELWQSGNAPWKSWE